MKAREFLDEAPLLPGLFKYSNSSKDRVPMLLNKIRTSSPFTIKTPQGQETVVIDPEEYDRVQAWVSSSSRPALRLKLQDQDRTIPLGAIIKTQEFGGESPEHRVRVELDQIQQINREISELRRGRPYIELKVAGQTVRAARAAKSDKEDGREPKSDLTIYDPKGDPVAWVSLKGHTFRWGGWTHLRRDPEVTQFVERVRELTGGRLENRQSFGYHPSPDLVNYIIYGHKFGGQLGPNNVTCVLVGRPRIVPSGRGYVLIGDRVYPNGDMPDGPHQPYLSLRYTLGRSDMGIKNARAESNIVSDRRRVQWLDQDIGARAK